MAKGSFRNGNPKAQHNTQPYVQPGSSAFVQSGNSAAAVPETGFSFPCPPSNSYQATCFIGIIPQGVEFVNREMKIFSVIFYKNPIKRFESFWSHRRCVRFCVRRRGTPSLDARLRRIFQYFNWISIKQRSAASPGDVRCVPAQTAILFLVFYKLFTQNGQRRL